MKQEKIFEIMNRHLCNADLTNEPDIYKCMEDAVSEETASLKERIERLEKALKKAMQMVNNAPDFPESDFYASMRERKWDKDLQDLKSIASQALKDKGEYHDNRRLNEAEI